LPLTDLSPNLSLLKLLVVDRAEAESLARSIINEAETESEFRRRLDLVEAILVNKFPQLSTEEILKMLDLKTADVTQTRFYQEVFQVGRQEGEQTGRQEGRQEGRQTGEADLVIRLLTRRCGVLSSAQEQAIRGLAIEQLEALGEGVLDFTGISDLVVWLAEIV
jgi:predicted transposase YdaD